MEKNKTLTERYEENEKKIDDVSYNLYRRNLSLEELGNISLSLNEKSRINEELLYDIISEIENNNKKSWKTMIIGALITLTSLGFCFVNIPIGILLAIVNIGVISKSIKINSDDELKDLLLKVYNQKSRITSYKNNVINKVKSTSKEINDNIWCGEELEMLFDISVRYVEMLLDGAKPDIESPYIELIVKELLKDENHPDASIEELIELAREKKNNKNKALEMTPLSKQ